MAPPSSSNAPLSFQLSDRALTPIISSSKSALEHHLTTTAVTSYDYASRLGLGIPQRIMIESNSGSIILHSYLTPPSTPSPTQHVHNIVEQTNEERRPLEEIGTEQSHMQSAEADNKALLDGAAEPHLEDGDDLPSDNTKQLIVSVIAPSAAFSGDARRMARRLERAGLKIQRLALKQEEQKENVPSEDGDG